ncbi:MAG: hypothetical protein ACFFB3_02635 [Candidatus Hodarchaeota archaeon]
MKTKHSNSKEPEIDEQALFEALSHSIRRQILRNLEQNILLSYSDFKQILGHGPGVIYHHLQKLQELGFLYQRLNKEYELTSKGSATVAYMNQATDRSILTKDASTKIQNFFLNAPLARFIMESPRRWTLELSLFLLFALIIQIEFPMVVIGFFLIHSEIAFHLRFGLQVAVFLVMALLLEVGSSVWNREASNSLLFLNSLLIFPTISAVGVGILWITVMAISEIPPWFYWPVIGFLQVCYFYTSIHLLMHVKKLSFEQSAVLALLISYFFFICGYLLG